MLCIHPKRVPVDENHSSVEEDASLKRKGNKVECGYRGKEKRRALARKSTSRVEDRKSKMSGVGGGAARQEKRGDEKSP